MKFAFYVIPALIFGLIAFSADNVRHVDIHMDMYMFWTSLFYAVILLGSAALSPDKGVKSTDPAFASVPIAGFVMFILTLGALGWQYAGLHTSSAIILKSIQLASLAAMGGLGLMAHLIYLNNSSKVAANAIKYIACLLMVSLYVLFGTIELNTRGAGPTPLFSLVITCAVIGMIWLFRSDDSKFEFGNVLLPVFSYCLNIAIVLFAFLSVKGGYTVEAIANSGVTNLVYLAISGTMLTSYLIWSKNKGRTTVDSDLQSDETLPAA